jgi:hypothetical protein
MPRISDTLNRYEYEKTGIEPQKIYRAKAGINES